MASDSTSMGEQVHLGQIAVAHHAHDIAVVTMRGEHDLSTRSALVRALELAAARSNVVVDLTECTFIDSTVIQEFIRSAQTVRANGDEFILVIPRAQAGVARVVAMVGLAQIVELHETTDTAFARLGHTELDRG